MSLSLRSSLTVSQAATPARAQLKQFPYFTQREPRFVHLADRVELLHITGRIQAESTSAAGSLGQQLPLLIEINRINA